MYDYLNKEVHTFSYLYIYLLSLAIFFYFTTRYQHEALAKF